MDQATNVPIILANSAPRLTVSAFMVVGPTPDGMMQVNLCDDLVAVDSMTVSFEQGKPAFTFPEGKNVRIIQGQIKMPIAAARQLAAMLLSHADQAEVAVQQALQGQA